MAIRFEEYGNLEFIEASEFYTLNAKPYDKAIGDDGEEYDIILVEDENGQRFVCGWI